VNNYESGNYNKDTIIITGTQPEKAKDIKMCQDYFQESNNALKDRRDKWKNHYSYWCNTKLSEKRPYFKSTTRVNYCWITTQVKVPIVMASNPTVAFVPFIKDPPHEENARKLSKIVGQYLYNKLNLRRKMIDAILNSQIYDAGFWKIGFNPNMPAGKATGEVFVTAIDPFKIFPDPLATSFDNARYVGHVEIYPVSTMQGQYPEFKDYIHADPSISEIIYEDRKWQDRRPRVTVLSDETKIGIERAYKTEWWISSKECDPGIKGEDGQPKYSNGRVITLINDKIIVDDRPYPYKHGNPPYVKFESNVVPNEFWSMGDIEQIIPLQDTLNHRVQQLEDIANKTANLGWTVHPKAGKKAIDNLKKFGMKCGLLKIMPPDMIKPDEVIQAPQYLFEEVKQLVILIERVTGISDVMQGRGDVRQRTARGIERLFEAGSARIGLSIKLFEDSFKDAAYQIGSLVRQYYTEDREINITGGSEVLQESFVIKPENLEEEMEVSIDSAAALPKDKQSRAELVFTLLKNHIFEIAMADDPKMKMIGKIVLDAVEFPNREAILNFTPDQLTKAFPSMGNQLNMQSGQPGQPQAQMPEFAGMGMPVLNSALEELAAAAQVSPEEMVEMIQSGVSNIQEIARPTS